MLLEDRCPHRGAPLSQGVVYDVCKVACADHGWTIDLRSGAVEAPERGEVRTFPVRVVDGEVFVSIAAAASYTARRGTARSMTRE